MLTISLAELEKLKGPDLMPFVCDQCQKPYFRSKARHMSNACKKGSLRTDFKTYCSKECQTVGLRKYTWGRCLQCNQGVKILAYRKTRNRFCNSSCAATWNNTHKTKGYRRSKLEVWLEEQLQGVYPKLKFLFNDKQAIESELDIYIPSLRLAFELNGIVHYEPIYGKEKLQKIRNNDSRKFQACMERKIELCIIDSSRLSYFKIKNAEPYLKIIRGIIDRRLKGSRPSRKTTHSPGRC